MADGGIRSKDAESLKLLSLGWETATLQPEGLNTPLLTHTPIL